MRRWAWLAVTACLGLPSLPAAEAASDLYLGAQLQVRVPVDVEHLLEAPIPGRPACGDVPAGRLERGRDDWFAFRDTSSEKGCLEARLDFAVPDGATGVDVGFHTRRLLDADAGVPYVAIPVNVTQSWRLYADDQGTARTNFDYIDREDAEAATGNRTPFHFSDQWPPGEVGRVTVGWAFEDRSTQPDLPPEPFPQQVFKATIEDVAVTFTGIPFEAVAVDEEHGTESAGLERTTVTVRLRIEPHGLGTPGFSVTVSDALQLEHIVGPLGAAIQARSIVVDSAQATRIISVDPAAVATHGYQGDYVLVFTGAKPLQANAMMAAFVALMVLMPGVMAGLSIRQWVLLRRQAGSSYPHVAQQYLWAILVAQAVYVIVLVWMLATQPFPLIAAWPMQPETLLLLGILLACTAAFFGLAFVAKGRLVRLAEADLAAKRRANLELQRSNRDLEQFAYVASHDLQEPLRAVAGYTQLLQHRYGTRLDDQARDYIRHAVEGADRMQGLIHGLLAYARIGTEGAAAAPVDLAVALGEALRNLEVPLRTSGGRVTHGPLPTVHADRAQVVQLLQNLVGNALKFHRPGQPPRVHVEARETGTGEWTVEVRDNGIGIPPEHQSRIFQIFQRLHPRDRYEGSGLGLAICQRIVERHGGRIWVDSRPGQGSRFCFTLPKSPTGAAR